MSSLQINSTTSPPRHTHTRISDLFSCRSDRDPGLLTCTCTSDFRLLLASAFGMLGSWLAAPPAEQTPPGACETPSYRDSHMNAPRPCLLLCQSHVVLVTKYYSRLTLYASHMFIIDMVDFRLMRGKTRRSGSVKELLERHASQPLVSSDPARTTKMKMRTKEISQKHWKIIRLLLK